jgi:hypothetical protein
MSWCRLSTTTSRRRRSRTLWDHLYREWHDKAVGFAGYGVGGGVRAVEHLRAFTAELGMAGVGPQVALNLFEDFEDRGRCATRQRQRDAATRMLGHLARWVGELVVWLGFELGIAPVLGLSQAKRARPVDHLALAGDQLLYGVVLTATRPNAGS